MRYKKLGKTDMKVSQIGFGASVFNNFFNDTKFDNSAKSIAKIKRIIQKAFDVGINYFDVAPWYGNAQFLLSEALKEHPRESYYLATKVGRYNSDKKATEWFDYSAKRTRESVEESLRLFNTDYIDLIQLHDFEFTDDFEQLLNETLPTLDEFRKSGKVRYIGINSYSLEKLKELLDKSTVKIDTVLSFTHLTLDDISFLDYIDYFKGKGVGIINSAPLSMGLYTQSGAPTWHNAPSHVRMAVDMASQYCQDKGVSLTKLALYFSASNPHIHLTVVSMSSEEIVEENVEIVSGGLNEHEQKVLDEIRNLYFIPLGYQGYGDKEVIGYRNKIKALSPTK